MLATIITFEDVLCNGENSVSEIVEKIYHQKGHVRFKTILKTLEFLRQRNFLENADQVEWDNEKDLSQSFLAVKSLFSYSFGKSLFSGSPHTAVFYILSMAIILSSILSLQTFSGFWLDASFLKFNNSYTHGLFASVVIASSLLTLKGLFKTILLLKKTFASFDRNIHQFKQYVYITNQDICNSCSLS